MWYILSSAVWHFPLRLQDLLLSAGRLTLLPINPYATFRSRCLDLVCHRQLNLRDIPLGTLLCANNNILFFLFPLISLDRPSNVTHFFVEKAQTTVKSHASSCFENWTHFQTTGLGTSCFKDRIHHLNLRKLVFWKYHGSAVKFIYIWFVELKSSSKMGFIYFKQIIKFLFVATKLFHCISALSTIKHLEVSRFSRKVNKV